MIFWAIVYAVISFLAGCVSLAARYYGHADVAVAALMIWFLFGVLGALSLIFSRLPGPPE